MMLSRALKRAPVLSKTLLEQVAGGDDEYGGGDYSGGDTSSYTYDDGSTYDASTNTSTEATDTGYGGGTDGGTQTYDDGSTYDASTNTSTEATDTGYYSGTQTYDDGSTYDPSTNTATEATDGGYFGGAQGNGTQAFDDGSTFDPTTGLSTPATDGPTGSDQVASLTTRSLGDAGDRTADAWNGEAALGNDGVQRFDDGSSLQTFDDGSTLARDSEGNFTSSPAQDGETLSLGDGQVQQDGVRASLAGDAASPPGVQRFDDGSSLQRFDDGSTLATDTDGNVTSTPATDPTSNEQLATRSIAGPGATDLQHSPDARASLLGGDGIQRFDDGSSLQTFDDGSRLVTDSDGNTSATNAPADPPRNDGQFVNGVDLSQHNLNDQQLQTLRDLEAGRPVGDGDLNNIPNTALAHLEAARNGGDLQLTADRPGIGHNGGPAIEQTPAQGPQLPSTTADPTRGTTDPRNLREQIAVNQARINPGAGTVITETPGDPRFSGYQKMQQVVPDGNGGRTSVHYMYDPKSGHATDFKITGVPPTAPSDAARVRQTPSSDGFRYGAGQDGIYKYDTNGKFVERVPELRQVPTDVQRPVGNQFMNNAWRMLGRAYPGARGRE